MSRLAASGDASKGFPISVKTLICRAPPNFSPFMLTICKLITIALSPKFVLHSPVSHCWTIRDVHVPLGCQGMEWKLWSTQVFTLHSTLHYHSNRESDLDLHLHHLLLNYLGPLQTVFQERQCPAYFEYKDSHWKGEQQCSKAQIWVSNVRTLLMDHPEDLHITAKLRTCKHFLPVSCDQM